MAEIISIEDLPQSVIDAVGDLELLQVMVDGANARASRVAPCLSDPTLDQSAEARLILIGAVSRWVDAGSGAFVQETAGPFTVTTDNRQRGGYNLWPSEVSALEALCASSKAKAFTIDTAPSGRGGPNVWGYETPQWAGPDLRFPPE